MKLSEITTVDTLLWNLRRYGYRKEDDPQEALHEINRAKDQGDLALLPGIYTVHSGDNPQIVGYIRDAYAMGDYGFSVHYDQNGEIFRWFGWSAYSNRGLQLSPDTDFAELQFAILSLQGVR